MKTVGTLTGIVQMLQDLSDPSSIGKAMAALSLLTVLYAVIISEFIFAFLQNIFTAGQGKENAQGSIRNVAFAGAVVGVMFISFSILMQSFMNYAG